MLESVLVGSRIDCSRGHPAADRSPRFGQTRWRTAAADVSADTDRRMPARFTLGDHCRCNVACCELCDHFYDRRSYARIAQIAVYGCGACRICCCIRTVQQAYQQKRALGVPCRDPCSACGSISIPRLGCNLPKYRTFYCADDMVTDPYRLDRTGDTDDFSAPADYRFEGDPSKRP